MNNQPQPSPSQASVILQRFLREHGATVHLNLCQEAVAKVRGFNDWNTLAARESVRGRVKIRQAIAQPSSQANGPAISHFHAMSLAVAAAEDLDQASGELQDAMLEAIDNSKLMAGFERCFDREERTLEVVTPFVEVVYLRDISQRFKNEVVFRMRDDELSCIVRTWDVRSDKLFNIVDERTGKFDTDVLVFDLEEPIDRMIRLAVDSANEHRNRLKSMFNIE